MKPVKYIPAIFLFAFLTMNLACKKFIEIPPPNDQLTSNFVFTNDRAAIEAITGIYSKMMENAQRFSSGNTTFYAGMSADEIYYYTPGTRDEFVANQITNANTGTLETNFWSPCYSFIYAANKVIEGAAASSALSGAVKTMITGEAKFIRAFCYFYLVNLFGDVPLILTAEYQANQTMVRTQATKIYAQMITDLKDAKNSLNADYPTSERVRPNKFAAAALLSRVYLYDKDWQNAETEASSIINSGYYSLEGNLNNCFLINSNETIWQLQPVFPSKNTWEGSQIIPFSSYSTPTYLLTLSLINSFEAGDKRKQSWINSRVFSGDTLYYPYKYKMGNGASLTEYYVVLRLAEQYLIRAEARAEQNDLTNSEADINVILARAGLPNTNASTQAELLNAVEEQRRIELFAEWGNRWFDLKRTNRADAVLKILKPTTWQPTDTLWPIPQSEINLNPALTQNAGY